MLNSTVDGSGKKRNKENATKATNHEAEDHVNWRQTSQMQVFKTERRADDDSFITDVMQDDCLRYFRYSFIQIVFSRRSKVNYT